MKKPGANGFTLMELMITVVVIAILAGIAYPSYTRYVAETRRSDATINLTRIAAQQEKFFTECGTYTANFNGKISDPVPANRCTGLGVGPTAGTLTTSDGYYTLTMVAGGAGFTITAQPASTQIAADNAKCNTFTINQVGLKTALGTDGNLTNGGKCWKK